jgi:hypothetical protein
MHLEEGCEDLETPGQHYSGSTHLVEACGQRYLSPRITRLGTENIEWGHKRKVGDDLSGRYEHKTVTKISANHSVLHRLMVSITHDRLFKVPRAKNAHQSTRKDAMQVNDLQRKW